MKQTEIKEQTAVKTENDRCTISHNLTPGTEKQLSSQPSKATTGAHIILNSMALFLAGSGLIIELASSHRNAGMFLESSWNPELQSQGLINLGAILAVIVGAIYAIVSVAAKRTGKPFKQYIGMHFSYLKDLSFVFDLVAKFCVVAMVVLVNKPELVAPLSLLFVGDYLIQRRFFTVPKKLSSLLGSVCMGIALVMFATGSSLLIVPFVAVILSAGFSLWQMIGLRKGGSVLREELVI